MLRSKRWYLANDYEKHSLLANKGWKNDGIVKISRFSKTENSYICQGETISVKNVLDSINKKSDYRASIDPVFENRRISLFLQKARPSDVFESIAVLFNSRQIAEISQSDTQKAEEKNILAALGLTDTDRDKESQNLRDNLVSLLDESEKKKNYLTAL